MLRRRGDNRKASTVVTVCTSGNALAEGFTFCPNVGWGGFG